MEQKHVPPCLSAAWRSMTMMLFLIPLALLELLYRRRVVSKRAHQLLDGDALTGEEQERQQIRMINSQAHKLKWWFTVHKDSPVMNKYSPATHMLISGLGWTGTMLSVYEVVGVFQPNISAVL
jgi:hypothetical protein